MDMFCREKITLEPIENYTLFPVAARLNRFRLVHVRYTTDRTITFNQSSSSAWNFRLERSPLNPVPSFLPSLIIIFKKLKIIEW